MWKLRIFSLCLLNLSLIIDSTVLYQKVLLVNRNSNPNSQNLVEPLKISSTNGILNVNLTVEPFQFNGVFSYYTRAFCYNGSCSVPGPTISVQPGDIVVINLKNMLKATTGYSQTGSTTYPNRTNMFFYGLHMDPAVNTPFLFTNGSNDSYTYQFVIPYEHAPGVHWYHSRVPGNAALHVMGGLLGAVVIRPQDPSTIPVEIQVA